MCSSGSFGPRVSDVNHVFGFKVDRISWGRPWPTFSAWREASQGRFWGFLDSVIDWLGSESAPSRQSDEEVEGAQAWGGHRHFKTGAFILHVRALWFWWQHRGGGGEFSLRREVSPGVLISPPLSVSLSLHRLGSAFVPWWGGCGRPPLSYGRLWSLGFAWLCMWGRFFLLTRSWFPGYQETQGSAGFVLFCF